MELSRRRYLRAIKRREALLLKQRRKLKHSRDIKDKSEARIRIKELKTEILLIEQKIKFEVATNGTNAKPNT